MSERFFRSNRLGYPHPVSSELENSVIRVAVGDCSWTERRRWRPPDQTGKTVHVHAKHYKHNEDGRTAPGVCGNGFVPLSHSGNVVSRIGIHTHALLLSVDLSKMTYRASLKTTCFSYLETELNATGEYFSMLTVKYKQWLSIHCYFQSVSMEQL